MAGLGAPLILHHGSAISGRERDLIVGYEFDAQEGVLINKEVTGLGGGSDGTIDGPCQMQDPVHGRGLRFTRGSCVVSYTSTNVGTTDAGAIAVTVRPWELTGGNTYYIHSRNNGGTRFMIFFDGADLYTRFGDAGNNDTGYDGTIGKSVRILVTWSSDHVYVYVDGDPVDDYAAVFANPLDLGTIGASNVAYANGLEGEIWEFSLQDRTLTAQEYLADYHRYARRARYEETLRPCPVTSTPAGGGRVASSWWTCYGLANGASIDIVDAPELERLSRVRGAKAFEFNIDSGLYIPVQYLGMPTASPEAAYGTFEFWVRRSGDSDPYIYFISDGIVAGALNGYAVRLRANERFYLYRVTAGVHAVIMRTVEGYVPVNEWIKITISRRYDGQMLVKFNDVPIPAAVIDSGTNPQIDNTFTAGSYFLITSGESTEFALPSQRFGEVL